MRGAPSGRALAALLAATVGLLWRGIYAVNERAYIESQRPDDAAGLIADGSRSFDGDDLTLLNRRTESPPQTQRTQRVRLD